MFAVEDWWITDMYCFVNHKPAMMHIEAIEDSCIFQLKKEKLDELLIKVPKFEKFFRILMQNAYIREQLRVMQTLSLTAEERYNNFSRKISADSPSRSHKNRLPRTWASRLNF